MFILAVVVFSCASQKQPQFGKYITDDPDFNFSSTIESALIYEFKDSKEVLIQRITAEAGDQLKHEWLGQEEEPYDIDEYNAEGQLVERRTYRDGKLRLTNVYLATEFGVPALDYQINEQGNKQQIWKPEVDHEKRTITLVQIEPTIFSSQDVKYVYNAQNQLIRKEHIFSQRPGFIQVYFYDSLGNVSNHHEERGDKKDTLVKNEYTFDRYGNWIQKRTTMNIDGHIYSDVYNRKIRYFKKTKHGN